MWGRGENTACRGADAAPCQVAFSIHQVSIQIYVTLLLLKWWENALFSNVSGKTHLENERRKPRLCVSWLQYFLKKCGGALFYVISCLVLIFKRNLSKILIIYTCQSVIGKNSPEIFCNQNDRWSINVVNAEIKILVQEMAHSH